MAGEPIASSSVRWAEGSPSCLPAGRLAVRVERRGGGAGDGRLVGFGLTWPLLLLCLRLRKEEEWELELLLRPAVELELEFELWREVRSDAGEGERDAVGW